MHLRGWRKFLFFGACIIILVWSLFPVYHMVTLSLVPENELFKPSLYVGHPTLDNYIATVQQTNYLVSEFRRQLLNSVAIALMTTAAVHRAKAASPSPHSKNFYSVVFTSRSTAAFSRSAFCTSVDRAM